MNITTSTTIVNMKHERADVNCGRGSIYGNPYRIGIDGTRDEVCDKYKEYFYKKILNPTFRNKVLLLKSKKLGCWCKPLRCHLETIKEYLDNN